MFYFGRFFGISHGVGDYINTLVKIAPLTLRMASSCCPWASSSRSHGRFGGSIFCICMHQSLEGKNSLWRPPRSTSTWKRIVISLLTSMTCIGCCGARISTSHKSPFLLCKWLHLCIAEGTFITIKLTMPWRRLVLAGCNHISELTRQYYLLIFYAYNPKGHHWVRCTGRGP